LELDPIPTTPVHQVYVRSLVPQLSATNLRNYVQTLSNIFTRYYTSQTGVQAATLIHDQFVNFIGGRTTATVRRYTHTWAQPSIIATIAGKGPHATEVVVIGAHEDSVGTSSTARSPGADDDASGVSVVLEVFRVLVASGYVPDRTIDFITYAGEEAGLLGSQAIANAYRSNGVQVHAAIQMDMTGYYSTNSIRVVTDYTDSAFNAFLRTLITTYTNLPWVNYACGYACSDHASWNRAGYRSAFPFENSSNRFIHTANDLIENLNFNYALEFAKLGLGAVVELAGRV